MKTTQNTHYIGIDISKDKIDVHSSNWKSTQTFENNLRGFSRLSTQLAQSSPSSVTHIVCEATGGYEAKLIKYALSTGMAASVVNPKKVRDFAKAAGRLAKTDAIDAEVITLFAECFKPLPIEAKSKEQEALQLAVRRRARLVRMRSAEKNALEKTSDKFIKGDIEVNIRHLSRRIVRLEEHIANIVQNNATFREKSQRMCEIVGVGSVIASTVLAELPELGRITNKQASSLVGLAPFNNDSGARRGARTTLGGRQLMRRTLYAPILSATQHNPIFKEFYYRLKAAGKPHHVAAVAVMRKLICLLNRLLSDPGFQPISRPS